MVQSWFELGKTIWTFLVDRGHFLAKNLYGQYMDLTLHSGDNLLYLSINIAIRMKLVHGPADKHASVGLTRPDNDW